MTSRPSASRLLDDTDGYRGVRALVLGANGFIGRWVARRLTDVGAHVSAAVRRPAAFGEVARRWQIHADVIAFDATTDDAVARLVEKAAPDVVFNLTGYGVDRSETDLEVMARINEALVRRLAEVLSTTAPFSAWPGRRLVHSGSALEYGLVDGTVSEDGPAYPHNDYGRTKLAGTMALHDVAQSTGLRSVTARPFTVFGPGEHPGRLLPTISKAAATRSTALLSSGLQSRDFVYVEDVAEGLLRLGLSEGPEGETVNLASGRLTTVRAFAETAASVLELPSNQLLFGREAVRADEMRITGVDVSRLRERTGWTPDPDLARTIRRSVQFDTALARDS